MSIPYPLTGYFHYATLASTGVDLVASGLQAERVNPNNVGISPKLRGSGSGPRSPRLACGSGF